MVLMVLFHGQKWLCPSNHLSAISSGDYNEAQVNYVTHCRDHIVFFPECTLSSPLFLKVPTLGRKFFLLMSFCKYRNELILYSIVISLGVMSSSPDSKLAIMVVKARVEAQRLMDCMLRQQWWSNQRWDTRFSTMSVSEVHDFRQHVGLVGGGLQHDIGAIIQTHESANDNISGDQRGCDGPCHPRGRNGGTSHR